MIKFGCGYRTPFVLIACIALGACSTTSAPAPSEPSTSVNSVELYLSRRSFSSTDFEQFKSFGTKLFVECGPLSRGHQKPSFQKLYDLDQSQLNRINTLATDILGAYALSKPPLEQPGDNSGMADPGQLFLTISNGTQVTELKTALDYASTPATPIGRKLKRIAEELRAASGTKICGFQSFYGIN